VIPVSYYNPEEFTSPKFAYAFAKGCGGTITDETELFPGPVALFGSPSRWPVLRQAQAEGRDFYYADHAYFGRGKYYRITKNAYQHDGVGYSNCVRLKAFPRMAVKPWRKSGRYIVLCPNSATYFGLHGLDVERWLREVKATLRQYTDRPITTRWKFQRHDRPIAEDLDLAWAVVVFSSASALDALAHGVPVFTLAPFAASARMGLSDLSKIETPYYPDDRQEFLSVLADNQWTIQELLTGAAWRALQQNEEHRAA
jgi:hypothetical protein